MRRGAARICTAMNETVEEILKGSYDLHVHAGPDPVQARRLDAMEAARHAYEAEMGGFALKSHDYPTAPLTYALERMYPGLVVAGSLVLNRQVGGLNPHAVRTSARLGARIVWMPTYCARFYRSSRGERGGIGILNSRGELLPEAHAVLEVVAGSGLALASGHLSPSETLALFRAAADRGCERLIVTHPAGTATDDELRAMTRLGAFVEYTWLSCLPSRRRNGSGGARRRRPAYRSRPLHRHHRPRPVDEPPRRRGHANGHSCPSWRRVGARGYIDPGQVQPGPSARTGRIVLRGDSPRGACRQQDSSSASPLCC